MKGNTCNRCGRVIGEESNLIVPTRYTNITLWGKDEGLEDHVGRIDSMTLTVTIDDKPDEVILCRRCKVDFLNFLWGRL